ncbi:hypothetical protein G4G28_18215 [Massilia sp. Dwa41.01b]|uniref:hypothetical protein n=1 Tax=unclassified Massilia TaxID=2609279 RepID=UPI001603AB1F|nr:MULTISPECIES: hypothetical protein [unclassified Massilia]QNA89947.1 hypothetical protein G4G28_18215 [Massilia sp. Dwa41.01b]QNB00829.1 hypothetical protein G4G31_21775 [Massilia sp. Se16.2.3]
MTLTRTLLLFLLAAGTVQAAPAARKPAPAPPVATACNAPLEGKVAEMLVWNDASELRKEKAALLKSARSDREMCINEEVSFNKAKAAPLLAKNDAFVAQQLDAAMARVEADPLRYLEPLLAELITEAEKDLDDARKVRSVAAACGDWPYSEPSGNFDDAARDRLIARIDSYRACAEKMKKDRDWELGSGQLAEGEAFAARLRRFACGTTSSARCLSDRDLDKLRRLGSRSNVAMVDAAEKTVENTIDEADEGLEAVNRYILRYNELVAERKQQREEAEERRSTPYYYTPPQTSQPEPYRRPSDTSAAGIR